MNEPRADAPPPPAGAGRAPATTALATLTPRVTRAWYVVAMSSEVKRKPLRRRLFGVPIVVWRGASGQVGVLVDRCPHRNVRLSDGWVKGETIQCGYHGWCFEPEQGRCTDIPGFTGDPDAPGRAGEPYAVVEQQGLVWVWGDRSCEPEGAPFRFPWADHPDYLTVRRPVHAPGPVHAVVENALDVPHTAFLHGGLFRTDKAERSPITCHLRRFHDRAEVEFVGEEAPEGLAARILAPSGGELTHVDRFHLPSITEVEYRLGEDSHVVLSGACTPQDDFDTMLYAVVSIRTPLPNWLVRAAVTPLALRIFHQDAVVLGKQTEALQAFGEARFASTEIDLLGPHILKLMHRAARGEVGDPDAAPYTREVTLMV